MEGGEVLLRNSLSAPISNQSFARHIRLRLFTLPINITLSHQWLHFVRVRSPIPAVKRYLKGMYNTVIPFQTPTMCVMLLLLVWDCVLYISFKSTALPSICLAFSSSTAIKLCITHLLIFWIIIFRGVTMKNVVV